jgi:general secretion pathway protein D
MVLAMTLAAGGAVAQTRGGIPYPAEPDGATRGGYGPDLPEDVIVQYDAETGSLIVITDEQTNARLQSVIEALDQPVPQVLINVLFLEVTHSDGVDLGTEFFIGDTDTRTNVTATRQDDGSILFGSETNTVREEFVETLFDIAGESTGGFYRLIKDDLNVTLRAMAETAKLEVLSRPSILTRNNQQATITVGQEVPFVRNTRILQDGQQLNTVEYEDIGIILQVTPHIRPDGLVEMQVIPEISTLTGETVAISAGVAAPVFAKRSAETGVVVPHGLTVVIGGLMSDEETISMSKVPLLGDIPVLGNAFKRKTTKNAKTELLIFLTPYIIPDPSMLGGVTRKVQDQAELSSGSFPKEKLDKYMSLDKVPEPKVLTPAQDDTETKAEARPGARQGARMRRAR